MKRKIVLGVGLVVMLALVGVATYMLWPRESTAPVSQIPTEEIDDINDEEAIRILVTDFGHQLQKVSLLDGVGVASAMSQSYGPYITPALLLEWQTDPRKALGRRTSSPWPEEIVINSITQTGGGFSYEVVGHIIEVTNGGGGIGEAPTETARLPVTLLIVKEGGWRIGEVIESPYAGAGEWTLSDAQPPLGVQFLYPNPLPTKYITPEEWPPLVEMTSNPFVCEEGDILAADGPLKRAERRTVGDRVYCVVTSSEGAAGSTYTTYDYITAQGDFTARVAFTLRTPQCANYDDSERVACESEQGSYDVDGLVDRIVSSIRMP